MARTRAFRRYQYELRKARHLRKYLWQWGLPRKEITPFMLGFHANTPHPCSSHCCGNPRKWWPGKRLRQERRADAALDDEW